MSDLMRPVTARGFRDVLPAEAAERDAVSRAIADEFASWGYGLVETPVAEDLAALEAAAGPLQGTAFRLIDLDGRLLALRPDMTVPIARLVASRLSGVPGPHRFRYAAEVFREHESLRGQARQFSQAGVELIGEEGPSADAEVVSLLVAALDAAGLPEFTIAIGTVAVLHAILTAAEAPAAWNEAVLAAAHERNLVGLDVLARDAANPAVARALSAVPRIRGGREAIVACREATAGLGCEDALDQLSRAWTLLEASGAASRVLVDFSVMRSFDYYTGLVLEAYAPGLGLPLAGGGRYDGVLAAFDAPAPAIGFALGLERVMIALMEQQARVSVRGLDAVLGGDAASALEVARTLRAAGWHVALSQRTGLGLVREAERLGAAEALQARAGTQPVRLDREGQPALPLEEPTPYPPTSTWAEPATDAPSLGGTRP
ncbi:MAG: ATP phosphoribosyltransferase regulatory subunit [Coriobacteriia bacterium]|nr:ATP phosphoribosyltransferase regulatory subunit [Coriobacteriia bacterium]